MPEYRVTLVRAADYGIDLDAWTYNGETPEPGQTITVTPHLGANPEAHAVEARVITIDDEEMLITAEQEPDNR
jgi:hypothetical protein